ncbi:uncharacterized protein TNCV_2858101 [Trichonephila clavipes]|nr:uncharacterized protein TNCV_2858101 [Trichonephila clavipes]
MSASARARASQKYKSRLSLERAPHTGTPMSGAERARRFRERRKVDAARNFSAAANLAEYLYLWTASNNTALEHRTHCPSTSSELPVRVSAAGGSAIYRNLQSSTNCSEIIVNANKSCGNSVLRKHNVGDIYLVDVKVEDLTLFILGAVYIHPKASAEAVKLCLYQSLLPYSANLTKLIPNSQPDLETPIVLCGDFNCDPQQNSYLVEFMRNEFGLNYVQTSPTTLRNTTIDCTFTRNINVDTCRMFLISHITDLC